MTGASDRGRQRREALLTAAAELLREAGLAGLSHRAVAARARLPLAATTYYFASLQDLRDEALTRLVEAWLDAARAALERVPPRLDGPGAVARAVVGLVTATPEGAGSDRDRMLVAYERYLEAGRHPRLQAVVGASNDRLVALVADVLARGDLPVVPEPRLVLALTDGALITALAEGRPPAEAAVAAVTALLCQGAEA